MKTIEENPRGLYHRYTISKTDGSPINPKNIYFVLKISGEGDTEHIRASKLAALTYADEIENHSPQLAKDIRVEVFKSRELKSRDQIVEDLINEMDGLFKQVVKYYPMPDEKNTRLGWNNLREELKERIKRL